MSDPATVLVVGAGGRVGRALARADWPSGLRPVLTRREALDPLAPGQAEAAIAAHRPRVILNLAGWTDVDGAERDPGGARRLNVDLPVALAKAAKAGGARLIHLSTDYVFDGEANGPYAETAPTRPLGVYGQTKRDGETAVLAVTPDAVIVRTAWLIGPDRPNFLTALLDRADAGEPLAVIDAQTGSPTPTDALADALIQIAARLSADPQAPGGVYHFAGAGEASWRDLAVAILAAREAAGGLAAPPVAVRAPDSSPGRAPRPRRSPLASDALARDYGVTAPPWDEAVKRLVTRIVRGDMGGRAD